MHAVEHARAGKRRSNDELVPPSPHPICYARVLLLGHAGVARVRACVCVCVGGGAHTARPQVIRNVVHCTTAGTVASWWFIQSAPSPTLGALKRSLTTSFGSICLGSLIVAILQVDDARARARSRTPFLLEI